MYCQTIDKYRLISRVPFRNMRGYRILFPGGGANFLYEKITFFKNEKKVSFNSKSKIREGVILSLHKFN